VSLLSIANYLLSIIDIEVGCGTPSLCGPNGSYVITCTGPNCASNAHLVDFQTYVATASGTSAKIPLSLNFTVDIQCQTGDIIVFTLDAEIANHPFRVQSDFFDPTSSNASAFAIVTDLTIVSQNTPGTSGTFNVTCNANFIKFAQVYFQCTFHGTMGGRITLFSPTPTTGATPTGTFPPTKAPVIQPSPSITNSPALTPGSTPARSSPIAGSTISSSMIVVCMMSLVVWMAA